jgi:hypothetical protein
MKKFIAIAAALVSFGAFADHHMENRHMVTLSGWENARDNTLARSIDLYHTNGGESHDTTRSIALNYAYAITGAWQVGAEYAMWDKDGSAKATEERSRYGVFAIYNFKGQLHNTNYLGLKYSMSEAEDKNSSGTKSTDSEGTAWTLEFGHRFSLGNLWGMNFNWSPSISAEFSDAEDNLTKKDSSSTEVALNVLKVDVLF